MMTDQQTVLAACQKTGITVSYCQELLDKYSIECLSIGVKLWDIESSRKEVYDKKAFFTHLVKSAKSGVRPPEPKPKPREQSRSFYDMRSHKDWDSICVAKSNIAKIKRMLRKGANGVKCEMPKENEGISEREKIKDRPSFKQ